MKIKRLDFSAHSNYAIDFYFDRQIFACRIAGGSRTWEAEEQSLGSKLNCMGKNIIERLAKRQKNQKN